MSTADLPAEKSADRTRPFLVLGIGFVVSREHWMFSWSPYRAASITSAPANSPNNFAGKAIETHGCRWHV